VEVSAGLEEGAKDKRLGAFALLRWDQIPELARRVLQRGNGEVTFKHLEDILQEMQSELEHLEYHRKDKSAIEVWNEYWQNARRDYGRAFVAAITELPKDSGLVVLNACADISYVDLRSVAAASLTGDAAKQELSLKVGGEMFGDDGLLSFRRPSA
jgi:hypothetical protein